MAVPCGFRPPLRGRQAGAASGTASKPAQRLPSYTEAQRAGRRQWGLSHAKPRGASAQHGIRSWHARPRGPHGRLLLRDSGSCWQYSMQACSWSALSPRYEDPSATHLVQPCLNPQRLNWQSWQPVHPRLRESGDVQVKRRRVRHQHLGRACNGTGSSEGSLAATAAVAAAPALFAIGQRNQPKRLQCDATIPQRRAPHSSACKPGERSSTGGENR